MLLKKNQSGFSLLLLLIILMGFGGFALANYSQDIFKQVEKSRFEHNKEVLLQAKQALLMYAYNYPQTHPGMGPGHLPCPDTVGLDGVGDPSIASCDAVGRFPWKHANINFYEAKDSSNEHLWYAVSDQFFNLGGWPKINSDSVGSISIFDHSGSLIYDGASTGVAAIIIAPGEPLKRDENNDGVYEYTQVRKTNAQKLDPRNYLDTVHLDPFNLDPLNLDPTTGLYDNSTFLNASNISDEGFIKGPVVDTFLSKTTLAVNDQVVVITTDELTAMAEKATLDTYQQSIKAYLANTGNVYPWLFDYNVNDLDTYSGDAANGTLFPDGALTNIGRIPSIFGEYFDDVNSEKFDSEVSIEVSKTFVVAGSTHLLSLSVTSSSAMTDVEFQDDGLPPNDDVKFSANANGGSEHTEELYFFDSAPSTGAWTLCLKNDAHNLSDCNMAALYVPTTGNGPNAYESRILVVGVSIDFTNDVEIKLSTTPPPTLLYDPPTSTFNHARVNAEFLPDAFSNIADLPSNVYYRELEYKVGGAFTEIEYGSQPLLDNTPFASPDIINQTAGNVTLGVRYYPVLPSWAKSNNWHHSVMMAIAPDYRPDGTGANDCIANPPCLTVSDIGGVTNDKGFLLTIAGSEAALVDDESPKDGFTDDLAKIFDPENANLDNVFLRRQGDDTVLVVQ